MPLELRPDPMAAMPVQLSLVQTAKKNRHQWIKSTALAHLRSDPQIYKKLMQAGVSFRIVWNGEERTKRSIVVLDMDDADPGEYSAMQNLEQQYPSKYAVCESSSAVLLHKNHYKILVATAPFLADSRDGSTANKAILERLAQEADYIHSLTGRYVNYDKAMAHANQLSYGLPNPALSQPYALLAKNSVEAITKTSLLLLPDHSIYNISGKTKQSTFLKTRISKISKLAKQARDLGSSSNKTKLKSLHGEDRLKGFISLLSFCTKTEIETAVHVDYAAGPLTSAYTNAYSHQYDGLPIQPNGNLDTIPTKATVDLPFHSVWLYGLREGLCFTRTRGLAWALARNTMISNYLSGTNYNYANYVNTVLTMATHCGKAICHYNARDHRQLNKLLQDCYSDAAAIPGPELLQAAWAAQPKQGPLATQRYLQVLQKLTTRLGRPATKKDFEQEGYDTLAWRRMQYQARKQASVFARYISSRHRAKSKDNTKKKKDNKPNQTTLASLEDRSKESTRKSGDIVDILGISPLSSSIWEYSQACVHAALARSGLLNSVAAPKKHRSPEEQYAAVARASVIHAAEADAAQLWHAAQSHQARKLSQQRYRQRRAAEKHFQQLVAELTEFKVFRYTVTLLLSILVTCKKAIDTVIELKANSCNQSQSLGRQNWSQEIWSCSGLSPPVCRKLYIKI